MTQCQCAAGWEGHDCSLPQCWQSITAMGHDPTAHATLLRASGVNVGDPAGSGVPPALQGDTYPQYYKCKNNGNCTLPNTCTCEKGWTGPDCTIPLCAQECFNGAFHRMAPFFFQCCRTLTVLCASLAVFQVGAALRPTRASACSG